jgi:hypothetical protein
MAGLYDVLASAQNDEAIDRLARQFKLTPQQTEEAVAALLPAISRGLKQSTETPEGFAGLIGMMAQENALPVLYDDDREAFGEQGRRAGNDALGMIFGSKDVSRAIADQAQRATGVGSSILKQMLPVVIGMILSGLLRGFGGGSRSRYGTPARDLKDLSDLSNKLPFAGVDRRHADNIEQLLDGLLGGRGR